MKIVPNVTRAAVDQSRHTTTYPRQAPGTSGRSSNITAEEVLIGCPANKRRTVLLRGGSARHSVVRTLRLSSAIRSRSLKCIIVSHTEPSNVGNENTDCSRSVQPKVIVETVSNYFCWRYGAKRIV